MRIMLLAGCLALAACGGTAPGVGTANDSIAGGTTMRGFPARDFTGVDLHGSNDVQVSTGVDFSVRAEGDAKALDRLDIAVRDGVLTIDSKSDGDWHWTSGNAPRVFVTMPAIARARIGGSGDLTIDRAEGDLQGAVAGSGDLTIGMLKAGTASFTIAGSGTISVAGSSERLQVGIDGSGNFKGGELNARTASITVSGSGDVTAAVDGDASIAINGSGDVDLGDSARCTISKSGSGDVTCGG